MGDLQTFASFLSLQQTGFPDFFLGYPLTNMNVTANRGAFDKLLADGLEMQK